MSDKTRADLAALKQVAEKATPGKREAFTNCPGECCWLIRKADRDHDDIWPDDLIAAPEMSQEDAEFGAAFDRETVLALIAVAEKAKALTTLNEQSTKLLSDRELIEWCNNQRRLEKELRSALEDLEK